MSRLQISRREFVAGAFAATATGFRPLPSLAANPVGVKLHGLSAFGDLKYPPQFQHFDYAVLDAPKGGAFAFSPPNWRYNQSALTFNTLNTFVLSGEAPPRMEYCFDTLMTIAFDEPDAIYGLVAHGVTISPDYNAFRFELRPEARFHDGSPLRARDVVWSLLTLKEKGHPHLALDLANLDRAEAVDELVVDLFFNGKQSPRAILDIASAAPILSQDYYSSVKFEDAALDAPLGSGRYKVRRSSVGVFIEYERFEDYWGRDLPVARGLDHFDILRIDFFQDRLAGFEAFKKGEVLWRQEFTSKVWAQEYTFPAAKDGRIRKVEFPDERRPSMQAFALNSRLEKFAHPATRQAIGALFDFEWTNKNLFFGLYQRSNTLFALSDFEAKGKPDEAELRLLEPLRGMVPEIVFGEASKPFSTDGTGRDRKMFRLADKLFAEGGWTKKGGKLVDAKGAQLSIEMLVDEPVFERILSPFTENLRLSGVDVSIRLADASQYQSRVEAHDFEMIMVAYSMAPNPTGETLMRYFHSSLADKNGGENHPGLKHPAIDRLVEAASAAQNRETLVVAMRALDRVLRATHYWIPNWHSANHRIACWDVFGWKDPKPDYEFPVERLWWRDPAKKTPSAEN